MDTDAQVKLEPDSSYQSMAHPGQSTLSHPSQSTHSYPASDKSSLNSYPQPDASIMNFITFRTSVEQTSEMLTSTWTQLHTLLNSYKAQLFSTETMNLDCPSPNELMKVVMAKERENHDLREELRMVNERYNRDIMERDRQLESLQRQINSDSSSSGQKIRRLEGKARLLEAKLEKMTSMAKSPQNRTSGRWTNRPSGRLLPGAGLVERRTPTPTQVARVTPVATPDKLTEATSPDQTQHYDMEIQQHVIKTESEPKTESETESGSCNKSPDNEMYMTQTMPSQCQAQKYVMVSGGESQGGGGGEYGSDGHHVTNTWSGGGYESTNQVDDSSQCQSLFLCPHCTQSFNNDKALDHHLQVSHRKFICPKCYEHYTKKYDLLNHIGLVHGKRSRHDSGSVSVQS